MDDYSEVSADMIEIRASGIFKTTHDFLAAGRGLGSLQLNAGKTEGMFQGVDGSNLFFKKTSFWKSAYQLSDNGKSLGAAKPLKALRKALLIDYGGEQYKLTPGGGKIRSWRLLNGEEGTLCEFQLRGAFKRGARMIILAPIEMKLLIFGYCLVSKRWQEESSIA